MSISIGNPLLLKNKFCVNLCHFYINLSMFFHGLELVPYYFFYIAFSYQIVFVVFFCFFFFCLVFHFVCRYYFCVLCLCWLYDRHLCSCACTLINTHWIEFNRIKVRRIDMLGLFHFHFCPYPKLPVIFPLSSCLLGICRISKTNMLINPLQNVPHPTTSTCCLCWTVPWLGTTHFQKCMYMQDV